MLEEAVRDGALAYDFVLPLSTTLIEGKAVSAFDAKQWYLIKRFAGIEAIKSLAFLHIRNFNPVNDQGFTVEEYGKWKEWLELRGVLLKELTNTTSDYKRMMNLQSMNWGTTSLTW